MITIEQVIEQCARIVDPSAEHRQNPGDYIGEGEGMRMLDDLASEIRALKQQYEGCIVAEGAPQHGRSVGTPLYRAREAK